MPKLLPLPTMPHDPRGRTRAVVLRLRAHIARRGRRHRVVARPRLAPDEGRFEANGALSA